MQTFAAAALLRRAGFRTVLRAYREYRVACSTGVVRVAPKDAFKIEGIKEHLFQ